MIKDLSSDSHDEWLSIRQAAELVPQTSYQAMRRWVAKGDVPAVTLPSGRKLIRCSDVEALLVPQVAASDDVEAEF